MMLRALFESGNAEAALTEWVNAVYDDAVLHAAISEKLPLAACVNQAIETTIEEIAARNAPPEFVAAVRRSLLAGRPGLIQSLADDLQGARSSALLSKAHARVLIASGALAAQRLQHARPRPLSLVV